MIKNKQKQTEARLEEISRLISTFQSVEEDLKNVGNVQEGPSMVDRLVIPKESTWKGVFDIVMLIASCYNVFSQAFYAAFGEPTDFSLNVFDYVIESLFLLDFIFCFFQEYKDEETYTFVSEFKKIAKNYMKGSCIFDLLAVIPFGLFIGDKEDRKLLRLFKLLRLPRLFALLNVDRFKNILTSFLNQRSKRAMKEVKMETYNFPILTTLKVVYIYKILRVIVIIFTSSYFLGIIWHILCMDAWS
jgi:hypothetical protein